MLRFRYERPNALKEDPKENISIPLPGGITLNPLNIDEDAKNIYPTSLRTIKEYNHLSGTPDEVHFIGMDFKSVSNGQSYCVSGVKKTFIFKLPFRGFVP